MKNMTRNVQASHAKGFSLIEVLISMFVLAIGILGAGALQTIGLQNSMAASTRSQAMFIAGDMVDRMRNNRPALASYVGTYNSATTTSTSSCISGTTGCSATSLVSSDIHDLVTYLQPVTSGGLLPGATVQVSNAGSVYNISVSWTEREWQSGTYVQNASAAKSYSISVNLADS